MNELHHWRHRCDKPSPVSDPLDPLKLQLKQLYNFDRIWKEVPIFPPRPILLQNSQIWASKCRLKNWQRYKQLLKQRENFIPKYIRLTVNYMHMP